MRTPDLRSGTVQWLLRQFPELSQTDVEILVDEAWDGVVATYGSSLDEDMLRRVFRRSVLNRLKNLQRTGRKRKKVMLPPPADRVDRFLDFILELGPAARKELVLWHKGLTPEESARVRGIDPESTKRQRRRLVKSWSRYLKGCPDLTEAEQRDFSPYIFGQPRLRDIL